MSERFKRLFSLPENLYSDGSPVIISAGALLKDTETGSVLAQLKIKSISTKPIKAVKVRIKPQDTVGKQLGEDVLFDYLDLNIKRDDEFGQKKPILFSDPSVRSFSAEVIEVDFTDNSSWESSDKEWSSLPELVLLEDAFADKELANQYRIMYGLKRASYLPKTVEDIWFCTCGAVNSDQEEKCHVCKLSLGSLLACDEEKLTADCQQRLADEKEKRKAEMAAAELKEAEEKAAAEVKAKKTKKMLLIAASFAAVIIVALIALFIFGRPIEGTWVRQPDDTILAGMTVEVSRNGKILEGKIVSMPATADYFEVGQVKWFNIRKVGFGKYKCDELTINGTTYSYKYVSVIRVLSGGNQLVLTIDNDGEVTSGAKQVWIRQN